MPSTAIEIKIIRKKPSTETSFSSVIIFGRERLLSIRNLDEGEILLKAAKSFTLLSLMAKDAHILYLTSNKRLRRERNSLEGSKILYFT